MVSESVALRPPAAFALPAGARVITLHGALRFGDEHPLTNRLMKFEALIMKYSSEPRVARRRQP
jgi:hypothetical protein